MENNKLEQQIMRLLDKKQSTWGKEREELLNCCYSLINKYTNTKIQTFINPIFLIYIQ